MHVVPSKLVGVVLAMALVGAQAQAAPISIMRVQPAGSPAPASSQLISASGSQDGGVPTSPCSAIACKSATPSVTYYGGRVISNVKIYAVIWSDTSITSPVAPSISDGGIAAFFTAVTNNDFMDWMQEYNTRGGTNQLIGRGAFAGQFTITPSTITAGTTSLTDAQIQAELKAQITAGNLPLPDWNTIYFNFFQPGVSIKDANGNASCQTFCAYHGTVASSVALPEFFYGVVPDYTSGTCSSVCGSLGAYGNTCAASSHEMGEAITDAEVGLATTLSAPLAWYDSNDGEIGDMCGYQDGSIYDFNGAAYWVQQLWSQSQAMCVTTLTHASDFKLWMHPNTATLYLGSSADVSVPVNTADFGTSQTLTLTASGAPAGVTSSIPSTVTSGSAATLTLSALGATTSARDAMLIVEGVGTTLTHTAALLLQVVIAANDFSVSAPASISVSQDGSATATVSSAVTTGAAQSIGFTAVGLPTGVTATFSPSPVGAGSSTTMTLQAAAGVPTGTSTFAVRGTSTSAPTLAHDATLQLTITPQVAARYQFKGLAASIASGQATTFSLTAVDAAGATVAAYSGTAHLTSSDPKAKLPASVTFVNGVATGLSVTFGTSGTQRLTATDSANSALSTAQSVNVTSGGLFGQTGCGCGSAGNGGWLALLALAALLGRRRLGWGR